MASFPPITQSGTTTTFLPLTTIWPAHDACTTAFAVNDQEAFGFSPDLQQIPGVPDGMFDCLPPEAVQWWSSSGQNPSSIVLSLAPLICPEQYETAAVSTINSLSYLLACCPSSYDFVGFNEACTSTLAADQNMLIASEIGNSWSTFSSLISSGNVAHAVALNGYSFKTAVEANSSPLTSSAASAIPTLSTSLILSTSTTLSTSPSPPESSFPTSSSIPIASGGIIPSSISTTSTTATSVSNHSNSPSAGVKAGIAISSTIGVLGLLAFIMTFRIRRKRQPTTLMPPIRVAWERAMHESSERSEQLEPAGLESLSGNPGQFRPVEIDGARSKIRQWERAELEGSNRS